MPREFARHQRLGNEVLRTLAELLRFETKDPRLKGVTLTSVDLTRDLSVARVYVSLLDPEEAVGPVMQGLERATGFLRGRLGKELKIRQVPELRFIHDESAEQSAHISELLGRARRDAPDR